MPEALTESLTKDLSHWLEEGKEEGQGMGQEDIFTSATIEKTLDPEWNEMFEMYASKLACTSCMQAHTRQQSMHGAKWGLLVLVAVTTYSKKMAALLPVELLLMQRARS